MSTDEPTSPETRPLSRPATAADATPPKGTPALSDLAATDALLDRLGAGTLGDDDLDDPAVTVLAELLAVVDDPAEVDGDVGRLVEVLGSRPLYLVGPDEAAAEPAGEEAPISLGPVEPRVIDLTARSTGTDGPQAPEAGTGDGDGAAEGEPASSSILPPNSKAQQRWGRGLRALQQVSLPAAGVLILLVLGGGVSAVVTGDPMAPVNGVTRVVSQLPGVDKEAKPSVSQVEGELNLAAQAVRSNDPAGAQQHLANARKALADLPGEQQARLSAVADQVQTQINTGTPPGTTTGNPGTGVPVVTPTVPSGGGVPVTTPADPPPATDNPPVTTPESPPVTTPDTTPPTTTTPPPSDPSPSDSASTESQTESSPSAT